MVYAVREIKEVEVARPRPSPFAPSPYYDVTELWFERPEALKAVAATPEWKAIVAMPAGTATIVVSEVEPKR